MTRWLLRNLAVYATLLAFALLVYRLWYPDFVTFISVARSVVVWIGLPSVVVTALLYPVGTRVSTTFYRLLALSLVLLAGCSSVLGDYRVLTVQLVVQVAYGLLVSKPEAEG